MRINDLIQEFRIYMNNEEAELIETIDKPCLLESFNEREQTIIQSLIRKSLVSKVVKDGYAYIIRND
jgi:hypothetical protein